MDNNKRAAVFLGMLLSAGNVFHSRRLRRILHRRSIHRGDLPGPKILNGGLTSNAYPRNEVTDGREGWVVLNMMIDPKGKPYEVMVADSSGNPAFEEERRSMSSEELAGLSACAARQ